MIALSMVAIAFWLCLGAFIGVLLMLFIYWRIGK